MRIAVNIGKKQIESDSRYVSLLEGLRLGGCDLRLIESGELLPDDTDVLLSVGGDGTFLASAVLAAEKGVPVLGVNLGRLGFFV